MCRSSKSIFCIMAVLTFSMVSCSPELFDRMKRQDGPVEIDGKNREWGSGLRYYDKTSALFYELRNDDTCLYIALSSNNANCVQRVLMSGFRLSFDTVKKGDYPFIVKAGSQQRPPQDRERGAPQGQHQRTPGSDPTPPPQVFGNPELLGFRHCNGIILALLPSREPSFFAECSIPLSAIYSHSNLQAADTARPIYVKITLPEFESRQAVPQGPPDRQGPGGEPPREGLQPSTNRTNSNTEVRPSQFNDDSNEMMNKLGPPQGGTQQLSETSVLKALKPVLK